VTAARIALLGVAAAFLAGCTVVPTSRIAKRPESSAPTEKRAAAPVRSTRVGVVDGDTGARIRGAVVVVARSTARTNRRGLAWFSVSRNAQLKTVASKPGYTTREVRVALGQRRTYFLRLYRRALQWPIYGARAQRTQAQVAIRVRPPFRVVWSRGLGTLVEFPAVVSDGVAYVSNSRGTVRALDMRDGTVLWRRETPHGKMAASPAVWRDQLIVHGMDGHVWVRRRSDGRLLWHYTNGSPIE
jgi:outer membrane protein assembly factor BamB